MHSPKYSFISYFFNLLLICKKRETLSDDSKVDSTKVYIALVAGGVRERAVNVDPILPGANVCS